jgi:hypothetical protein
MLPPRSYIIESICSVNIIAVGKLTALHSQHLDSAALMTCLQHGILIKVGILKCTLTTC